MAQVTIEKMANGYTVRANDPKIVAANDKRDNSKGPYVPYKNPSREFVFTDLEKVLVWLKANLDTSLPDDDYSSSFDNACCSDD